MMVMHAGTFRRAHLISKCANVSEGLPVCPNNLAEMTTGMRANSLSCNGRDTGCRLLGFFRFCRNSIPWTQASDWRIPEGSPTEPCSRSVSTGDVSLLRTLSQPPSACKVWCRLFSLPASCLLPLCGAWKLRVSVSVLHIMITTSTLSLIFDCTNNLHWCPCWLLPGAHWPDKEVSFCALQCTSILGGKQTCKSSH